MIDLLEDETTPSPQEDITRFLQHERIDALLKKMNERERRVLVLRYGLDDNISRTLGETAKFFNITRERVRQIEVAAMRKLRVLIATEEQETADRIMKMGLGQQKTQSKKKVVNGKAQ